MVDFVLLRKANVDSSSRLRVCGLCRGLSVIVAVGCNGLLKGEFDVAEIGHSKCDIEYNQVFRSAVHGNEMMNSNIYMLMQRRCVGVRHRRFSPSAASGHCRPPRMHYTKQAKTILLMRGRLWKAD
jgi:hypothetical protein